MGGGETKTKKETAKRLRRRGGGGGSAGGIDLTTPICERAQTVAVRLLASGIRPGTAVRVVLGDPPAVVAGQRTIGRVAGRAAAATLSGCLQAGYDVTGKVVSVNAGGEKATATVIGVRSR